MLGLFGTLNLGARALQAQQTGIEVTGHNLANVNNPAYARQRVVLQTADAIPTSIGPEGTGVQVTAIQQIRNALLDGQIRDETSVTGYWDAQQTNLQNVQTALNEFLDQSASTVNGAADSGSAASTQGLSAQLTALFNAFQSVAASPTSLSERQNLVSQAQSLAAGFNQVSTRLGAVKNTLDASITSDSATANQYLSDIATLNQQISTAEAGGGGTANDLRDLREQKLEGLAQLMNFQTTTAADGTLSISVGSEQFVSGGKVVSTLETEQFQGKLVVYSATDNAGVPLTGGSIKAAVDSRDVTLANLQSGLDSLASQLITQVNSVYQNGYDLNGGTGAAFFTGNSAATIGVNGALGNDPSLVQAAGTAGAAGDNAVALALANLAQQPNAALNNKSFGDAYNQLVQNLGSALSNANDQVANQTAVNSMLMSQRDSVSGVSVDEEMTNLIGYQKAYEASAKLISAVDQMLETLINMKN